MSYLNSVTLVGFVGADPEQRQTKGNGTKFTVLSVATQRSWKSTQDEWASKTEWHRVCVFRPQLAERVATAIKKGSHVLVEGELVSSTYERPNGKSKKSATTKITSWSIRADVVRKLDRGEPEPEVFVSGSDPSEHSPEAPDAAPFYRFAIQGGPRLRAQAPSFVPRFAGFVARFVRPYFASSRYLC
jgi:single stranded DNA-binding protein